MSSSRARRRLRDEALERWLNEPGPTAPPLLLRSGRMRRAPEASGAGSKASGAGSRLPTQARRPRTGQRDGTSGGLGLAAGWRASHGSQVRQRAAVAMPEGDDLDRLLIGRELEVEVVADPREAYASHSGVAIERSSNERRSTLEQRDDGIDVFVEGPRGLVAVRRPPLASLVELREGSGDDDDRRNGSPARTEPLQSLPHVDALTARGLGLAPSHHSKLLVRDGHDLLRALDPHRHRRPLFEVRGVFEHEGSLAESSCVQAHGTSIAYVRMGVRRGRARPTR